MIAANHPSKLSLQDPDSRQLSRSKSIDSSDVGQHTAASRVGHDDSSGVRIRTHHRDASNQNSADYMNGRDEPYGTAESSDSAHVVSSTDYMQIRADRTNDENTIDSPANSPGFAPFVGSSRRFGDRIQPAQAYTGISPTSVESLWNFLLVELTATDADHDQGLKKERIINFFLTPRALEPSLLFGWLVCFDSFLYCFTILPLRVAIALIETFQKLMHERNSWSSILWDRASPQRLMKTSQKVDIWKGVLIFTACALLHRMDASRIYHTIRGQSTIKLYVIYNVIEIADRLFAAIGQDILDCFFSKSTLGRNIDGTRSPPRMLLLYILSLGYLMLHTTLIFYQAVTLNVTINSYGNALLTLLMSNQVVEIKGAVFKKFEKENLFQITCADMVERFQLTIILFIVGSRNWVELSNTASSLTKWKFFSDAISPVFIIFMSEFFVDWMKHAFIMKFNGFRPSIYTKFINIVCRDYVTSTGNGKNVSKPAFVFFNSDFVQRLVDQSPAVARRIGLPVLPLVCVTVRGLSQVWSMWLSTIAANGSTNSSWLSVRSIVAGQNPSWTEWIVRGIFAVIIVLLCLCVLLIVKLVMGAWISNFAHERYAQVLKDEHPFEDEYPKNHTSSAGQVEIEPSVQNYLRNNKDDVVSERKRTLSSIERYSMVSKRIW